MSNLICNLKNLFITGLEFGRLGHQAFNLAGFSRFQALPQPTRKLFLEQPLILQLFGIQPNHPLERGIVHDVGLLTNQFQIGF